MFLAHRIALDPDNVEATYLARAAGVARFSYNWALRNWMAQYAAWKADPSLPTPNEATLRRQLNAVKDEQFPWMREVTKTAPQMEIMQLGQPFNNFSRDKHAIPPSGARGVTTD